MTGVLLLGVFVYTWKVYLQDLDLQTCHLSRIESETQAIALTNE